MSIVVDFDSVLQGSTEVLMWVCKKIAVDARSLQEDAAKNKLSKHSYQKLVQFQDECIKAYDAAGTLTTLLLIRDYGKTIDAYGRTINGTNDGESA